MKKNWVKAEISKLKISQASVTSYLCSYLQCPSNKVTILLLLVYDIIYGLKKLTVNAELGAVGVVASRSTPTW